MRPNKQKLVNSRCRKYNGHTTKKSHTVLQEKIELPCAHYTQNHTYIYNMCFNRTHAMKLYGEMEV
jgi:hypothetical protein